MTYALDIAGLSRSFGEAPAVDGISLRVERGEIFAITGPDGAGKTTLIRLICGALRADAGTVRVDGMDVASETSAVQSSVGYMPQRFSLYPDLSVAENLRFYGAIFGVAPDEFARRSADLLRDFSLSDFRSRPAGQLSGGMKQKLALTCALIHSPRTLLLDEPTAGVDPVSRRAFWRDLAEINRAGTTIFVSTPYMDEAERAGRVAFMHHGRILSCGTPAQLKAQLGGSVIEISCSNRARARRALRDEPLVRSIEIFGETLHALVPRGSDALPVLGKRLESAGVTGAALREIEPSLEDTFVAGLTA